jgi:hypothetical protein
VAREISIHKSSNCRNWRTRNKDKSRKFLKKNENEIPSSSIFGAVGMGAESSSRTSRSLHKYQTAVFIDVG